MDNKNTSNRPETEKGKNGFWKTLGVIGIALFLALLTVIIINLPTK